METMQQESIATSLKIWKPCSILIHVNNNLLAALKVSLPFCYQRRKRNTDCSSSQFSTTNSSSKRFASAYVMSNDTTQMQTSNQLVGSIIEVPLNTPSSILVPFYDFFFGKSNPK
ncbi:hypothetical protein PIB30_075488, partial [Stylosanthes scabra]|nr:hypothetical protein [Stylosanthes scabra]